MTTRRWSSFRLTGFAALLCILAGCGVQAPYMKGWDPVEGIPNRWTNGTINAGRLSEDERALFEESGPPNALRYFRSAETREPVYEWIYTEPFRAVWFVSGARVDYVTVDANVSARTAASRQALATKFRTGGLLAGAIAGTALATVSFIGD